MVRTDLVNLVKSATAQTIGAEYMNNNPEITGINPQELVDIGKSVIDANSVDGFVKCCATQMLKMDIESKFFEIDMPPIVIDRTDWLGYIQAVDFDIVDVYTDPMRNLVNKKNYSDIEHTFYQPNAESKIYDKISSFMAPISLSVEEFEESVRNWDELDRFLTGVRVSVRNTLKIQLLALTNIICSVGAVVSINKTLTAVHLITEATSLNILQKTDTVDSALQNMEFLKFMMERMVETRYNMRIPTKAFNNHNTVKMVDDDDYRFMLHSVIARKFKFHVLADTYNSDEIGIGKYYNVTSWQAITDTDKPDFDLSTTSQIKFNADSSNTLGLGTTAITENYVIGLMFHKKAIGVSFLKEKVTTSNTYCADFWTQYIHETVGGNVNENYPIVAFVLD